MSAYVAEVLYWPENGAEVPSLDVGTRIRSRQFPELTGYIKGWEYNRPGVLSVIPYLIRWDDSARAAETLGWFFVYGSDYGVEREWSATFRAAS